MSNYLKHLMKANAIKQILNFKKLLPFFTARWSFERREVAKGRSYKMDHITTRLCNRSIIQSATRVLSSTQFSKVLTSLSDTSILSSFIIAFIFRDLWYIVNSVHSQTIVASAYWISQSRSATHRLLTHIRYTSCF